MAISKLPQGWVECELKNIAKEIISGSGFPKIYQGNKIGDYPFAKVGDISKLFRNKKKTIDSAENYINEDVKDKIKGKIFPANTIVFPKIGEALKGNYRLITRKKMLFDNNVMGIVFSNNINILFLYYFLVTQDFGKFSVATTIPSIQKGCIEGIKINLPPLNEQRRIVGKIEEEFGKIDEGVEKLRFALEQIKQYRQAVLKSAFDGKLYKTTEWEEKTLGQILTPRRERITPNKHNGELPFIGMDCIMPNSLKIHNSYKLKDTKSVAFVFYKNDVLYGRMRSYLNKVWQATFDGASSAEFIVFPENKQITSGFLKYLLHQQTFVKYATRNASGDRPRVKFEADLAEYKIKLPKIDEQNLIVEKIENAFSIVEDLNKIIRQNLDKAEQLKQSILKKAFEGRLVPQDPNDEPASVLLEKIKAERKNK